MNYYLYDKIRAHRYQELDQEMANARMLRHMPRRNGVGRRAIGGLGVALVAVGFKLQQIDYSRQPHPTLSSIRR